MAPKPDYSFTAALLLSLFSAPLACSSARDANPGSSVEATGELVLPLVSRAQGSFRLRHALFNLSSRSGAASLRLDSEADSELDALRIELAQDAYSVLLEDGWVLERLEQDGSVTQQHAALVSPNPSDFEIRNGRATRLSYTFTTDDGTVSFGSGALELTVAVSSVTHASCRPLDPSSCPSEQTCLLADDAGQTFCAEPGALPIGSPCGAEQCIAGAQCLKLDPANPEQGVCARFCNPNFVEFGCECRSLSFDSAIGVCDPPPFPICDPLAQSGCGEAEACQYSGGNFAVCGTPGAGQIGDYCLGETCAAGLDCLGDAPEVGSGGTCRSFCDTRHDTCPQPYYPYFTACSDVGTANLGRCL